MQKLTMFLIFACIIFMLAALTPASAQVYSITKLGALPGAFFSESLGLNNSGQVVGRSASTKNPSPARAFLWTKTGGMQDLGAGDGSVADGVNNSGQVVGGADFSGFGRAFLWTQAGGLQDLGVLDHSACCSTAMAINASGQVVGSSQGSGATPDHAFLWTQAGGMQDLGTLMGGGASYAEAINVSGQVAGYSEIPGTFFRAFLWTQEGGMRNLGTLGGNESTAYGINGGGQVVGESQIIPNGHSHSFLWTQSSGMQDLGTLVGGDNSYAVGINASGQVVGTSETTDNPMTIAPFVWTKTGGMQDLNKLTNSPRVLEFATAINRAGQITVNTFGSPSGGQPTTYLLTPIMYTALVSSSNPSSAGQVVTFTASVRSSIQGPPPNGEGVSFKDGTKILATVALSKGVAAFSTSALTAGTHTITATYLGDINYASSKAVISQVVNHP